MPFVVRSPSGGIILGKDEGWTTWIAPLNALAGMTLVVVATCQHRAGRYPASPRQRSFRCPPCVGSRRCVIDTVGISEVLNKACPQRHETRGLGLLP